MIERAIFGQCRMGEEAFLFTLTNLNGMRTQITNYGCYIVTLEVPDRAGQPADVVLGYDTLAGYEDDRAYIGCVVGRYANRIAGGRFTLDGKTYVLDCNDNGNHLHGGFEGFNKRVWQVVEEDTDANRVVFHLLSPDGDQHYPGNLSVQVAYTLLPDNALCIDYTATTDQDTIVNLTNHSYFNLAGGNPETILDHQLEIAANYFTPIDEHLIPTGELRPVAGTPFDFTRRETIGRRIDADDEQLRLANGYDHNWVLDKPEGALGWAARLVHPGSGRLLEVETTEPGIQFYSGNFLDGSIIGKRGHPYRFRSGLCLETQHFPDSPNHPTFPSTVLRPGEVFRSTTVFRFGTEN